MYTETIDLNIGGIEFSQCIVDFEYDYADAGAPDQPPYSDDLQIYRVQFLLDHDLEFNASFWVDLQEQHFCMVESQVLGWIYAKQEQAVLDTAETYTEKRMREMENETWRAGR